MLGTALLYSRGIVFRRVFPNLRAVIERSRTIYNRMGAKHSEDDYNESLHRWRFRDGRLTEMGACQHTKDAKDHQGQPHDFYGFDEITEFTEYIYTFITTWLRPLDFSRKQRKPRIIAAGNPPTDVAGMWVMDYWGAWLRKPRGPGRSVKALPGELLWYAQIDGKSTEVKNGDPFEHHGEIITPRSRTFIPATIEDNPLLIAAGYKARLQALPEPLRSKFLYGDFSASVKDDPWQLFPTKWVEAAQERWKQKGEDWPQKNHIPMTQLGVDVSRGGKDRTTLVPRYDNFIATPEVLEKNITEDGSDVAMQIIKVIGRRTVVCIDVIGVGSSVYDFTKKQAKTIAFDARHSTPARDRKTAQLGFSNVKSYAAWQLREALDPELGDAFCLPPDPQITKELCCIKWSLTPTGIRVQDKEDIIEDLGFSPDLAEGIIYANYIPYTAQGSILELYGEEYEAQKRQEAEVERRYGRHRTH